MQADAPEEVPSAPEQNTVSQNNNKRRFTTTDRSTRTISEQQPESSGAPSTGRRTLTRSSPQRGSSREMTPPESAGTIKYTRTGRVSKATKGQRVHNCEECGKVSRLGLRGCRLTTHSSAYVCAAKLRQCVSIAIQVLIAATNMTLGRLCRSSYDRTARYDQARRTLRAVC